MPKLGTIERQHWWWAGSSPYSISNLHLFLGCPAWGPQNQYLIFFGSLRKLSTSSRKHHKKLFAARRKETKHLHWSTVCFPLLIFIVSAMYVCIYVCIVLLIPWLWTHECSSQQHEGSTASQMSCWHPFQQNPQSDFDQWDQISTFLPDL